MSDKIRGTMPPDHYEMVESELDRIYGFFEKKWLHPEFSMNDGRYKWNKYLTERLKQEHVLSDTHLASPLDYLLERIYSAGFDKVVVKDPDNSSGGFILLDRDFAQKVLVLGGLP